MAPDHPENSDNSYVAPKIIPDGSDPSLFEPPGGVNVEKWRAHVEQALARGRRNTFETRMTRLVRLPVPLSVSVLISHEV